MLVVSDASPINILVRLGRVDILATLFHTIVVPPSVADEMSRPRTPQLVRDWISAPPPWLKVQSPAVPEPATSLRHRGERDAIRLARELGADAILLDDEKPRLAAARLGLRVVGTIGVLEQAANMGHIADLKTIHDQLRASDFYIGEQVLRDSLRRHLEILKGHRTI
jgi:predicted nucleic acid-binding protein